MKSLYVTSVEHYSGKTAVCLGLGKRFQADGYKVGYIKPLSLQPWMAGGHIADEDAGFVKEILGLAADPWDLSPVVVTPEYLRERLGSQSEINLIERVKEAVQRAGAGQDVLLLEGGGSLREGYVVGLPTPVVATELSSHVLVIVKYRDDVRVLDDALASQTRLGKTMSGVIINRVPSEANEYVTGTVIPYFEKRGIPVFGVLPEARSLAALTVGELISVLDAEVLTKKFKKDALVENLTVGAMTPEAALRHFRRQTHQAVITGGDRTDIQLAALETSTACLILTGNLRPSPLVVKQAEEFGVAVLLVSTNTIETVEKIEGVFGKTRLGQPVKLRHFQNLLEQHINIARLYDILGLEHD
jgi:BioD-like phosphotransacetylase family protein